MTLALILASFLTTAEIEQEYHCATQIVYHEARGEHPYMGKALPMIITGNRVLHEEFPDTFCDVLYEPGQYELVDRGLHRVAPSEPDAWRKSKEIVDEFMNEEIVDGHIGLNGAVFFQHVDIPNWNPRRLVKEGEIGNHKYFSLN